MAYSSIIKPQDYFSTKLYDGTGSSHSVTGVGFQPDFCWVKMRSGTENHFLNNAIQGSTKVLQSDTDAAEQTSSAGMTSFDSDGFTVNTDTGFNGSGSNYVAWNWKANGQGSSNTDGSINTTYTSANTTSGFSIVKYTGTGSNATVGHGLGVVPKMIIVKCLDQTHWWFTYHVSVGNDRHMTINTTNDQSGTSANYWNNTTPTSSVFSIGTDTGVNQSGQNYIAYCFAEVKGFSKIGSYYGNGNSNGPFTYTGFKPAFVLFKEYTGPGSSNWTIQDDKREGYNISNSRLFPNDSAAGNASSFRLNLLSNGFKINNSDSDSNRNGNNFLYLAFAEHPFVANVDGGLPTTAR